MFAEQNNCEVKIYIEPKPSTHELTYMDRLRNKENGHESGEDDETSDESMNGIHFEGNDEKIMHDFDEDFGEGFIFRVDERGHRRGNVYFGATSQPPNRMFTT